MSAAASSPADCAPSELNYLVVHYLEQCTNVDKTVLKELKRSLEDHR